MSKNEKILAYNEDFEKEKDLVEFICINIKSFVTDILDDKLLSFEINKPIETKLELAPRSKEIDLFIKGVKNTYIIEAKRPRNSTSMRSAIGQILDYGREITDPKKKLIIISTWFDYDTMETIKHYNLPIRYMYISKENLMEDMEWKTKLADQENSQAQKI